MEVQEFCGRLASGLKPTQRDTRRDHASAERRLQQIAARGRLPVEHLARDERACSLLSMRCSLTSDHAMPPAVEIARSIGIVPVTTTGIALISTAIAAEFAGNRLPTASRSSPMLAGSSSIARCSRTVPRVQHCTTLVDTSVKSATACTGPLAQGADVASTTTNVRPLEPAPRNQGGC